MFRYRELEIEASKAVDLIPPKLAERLGESALPKAGTNNENTGRQGSLITYSTVGRDAQAQHECFYQSAGGRRNA